MLNENRSVLMKLRLEQANKCLESALLLSNAESNKDAANRSYYAIFHAMRAVLASDCFDSKKHSGIISEFRRRYIKNGIFPKEFSDIIEDAFDVRTDSDYNDFYVISKDDVTLQIENAKTFLAAVEDYIESKKSEQQITDLELEPE